MSRGRILILCLIAAMILSGCGRRGGLEKPPRTTAADRPAESQQVETVQQSEPRRAFQKKQAPERPFILDGLI